MQIIRADGSRAGTFASGPAQRVRVVGDGDRMESGNYGTGGRETYETYLQPDTWHFAAEEALRQALVNLESVAAPAGEMPVVLGPGWPAILLHEAIGHGLEGDFNRKKTSAFSELMGERVAAAGVTVVDDGTLNDRRGSLTIDDEGTPAQRTVLIEDGILTGYMQDRMNARLMGVSATGNGRRSYARADAAHDQHPYGKWRLRSGGNSEIRQEGLYAVNWRRTGGHHIRQVRVHLYRSLPGRGW